MVKAIIIEDEIHSQVLMKQMLEEYCEDILLLGIAADVQSGISLIKEKKPDVIFLDVEIPGGSGFDILNAFETPDFKVIFATGYDHYAIKAIKHSAIDYLLKPVNLTELQLAINKIKSQTQSSAKKIHFLRENIKKEPSEINQIVLSDNKRHNIIKIKDILYIESDGAYVSFHLINGFKYTIANSLHFYEELLPENNFFRIHKSYLINGQMIDKLEIDGRGGTVHLSGHISLPVAVRRKPAFVKFLNRIK